jgi:preprotein translocase SecF subunit
MKSIRFFDPKNEINFVKYFKPMLLVAALVPVVAVIGSMVLGINWGIDFQGGTEMQVLFSKDVPADDIRKVLEEAGFEKHQVQRYGEEGSKERLIRVERLATFKPEDVTRIEGVVKGGFPALDASKIKVQFNTNLGDRLMVYLPEPHLADASDQVAVAAALASQRSELAQMLDAKSGFQLWRNDKHSLTESVLQNDAKNGVIAYNVHFTGVSDKISSALAAKFGQVEVRRVEFVDSQVSEQLRTDGVLAVLYALLAILVYIAIRFNFFFAPGAIVALIQDTFGAYLVFVFLRYEFDLPSVAALLTVLGVSINNTIVVYDRIRETMPHDPKKPVDNAIVTAAVNKAVNDTMSRTINTTLTVVIASLCLWWFAGGVISSFAMVLTVGLSLGAVSSTFAAPAMYLFMRRQYGHLGALTTTEVARGQSREDKLKGVV